MKKYSFVAMMVFLGFTSWAGWAMANEEKPFTPNVDPATGAISVPEDYTLWPTLGTWTHAKTDSGAATIHEYHVVYTQPETIEFYQKKRRFPDGAVLVKELLHAETMSMTTGPAVGHATTIKGFFVLVTRYQGPLQRLTVVGGGLGVVVFQCGRSRQHDIHEL